MRTVQSNFRNLIIYMYIALHDLSINKMKDGTMWLCIFRTISFWKLYNDQACSRPRDEGTCWHHGDPISGPLKLLEHQQLLYRRVAPPLCRQASASWTADKTYPVGAKSKSCRWPFHLICDILRTNVAAIKRNVRYYISIVRMEKTAQKLVHSDLQIKR